MSPRKAVRTVFFAVSAAVALSVGPAILSAPVALAAPGEFPFASQGGSENEPESRAPDGRTQENRTPENRTQESRTLENDLGKRAEEAGERAEEAGGGVVTEVIDLSAGILKCGLHIATPAVKCPLHS